MRMPEKKKKTTKNDEKKPQKKRGPSHKFDWVAIGADYVSGEESLRQIAEKYEVSFRMVSLVSSRDKWNERRKKQREEISAKVDSKNLKTKVFERAKFDSMTQRSCDVIVAMTAVELTTAWEEKRIVPLGDRIKMIAAVRDALDVKYKTLNIGPPKQQIRIENAESFADKFEHSVDEIMKQLEEANKAGVVIGVQAAQSDRESGGNGKKHLDDFESESDEE